MADPLQLSDSKRPETVGQREVAKWRRQIQAALKREEKYRKKAAKYVELYEAEKEQATPFNILYSNTETLAPALFNELPRPVVQRRYKDEDPLGKLASRAIERGLEYVLDSPDQKYEPFFSLIENAVLSALVPGRGITQLFYDADIDEGEPAEPDEAGEEDEAGDIDGEESETAEEILEAEQPVEQQGPAPGVVKYETICGRVVAWDRICFGYAKRWVDVPWVAFEHLMTKDDVLASFGPAWVQKLSFNFGKPADGDQKDEANAKREELTCRVWEIWHKDSRSIIFLADGYEDSIIKRAPDPLKLSGFYNIPEPLMLFNKVSGLVPVPLYALYEQQATELNRLTIRINKITEAIKVRGFYDKTIGDLQTLFTKDDNTLIPATGVGAFADGKTVDKAIWLMPLQELANTLQTLVQERQMVKQVIYEVTGISDILRGSSVASETATAQNIKNQWGTLRLKRMQKRVQRYVRDMLRIAAELMAEHFSEETFAKQTGMPIQSSQEKQQAQQALQQMQAQPPQPTPPPQPGPDGQPAGPPPPDPMQQKMQQMQQQAEAPSWGDILQVLQNDLQRNYKIDIETNSTVDPEAVEDKQAIGEMMQALSGMLQQLMPAAQQGILPLGVVKSMLMSVTRRFRFGPEVEDALMQMPEQQPGPNPEEVQKQQAEVQKQQEQLQQEQQQLQQEKQQLEAEKQAFNAAQAAAQERLREQQQLAEAKLQVAQDRAELAIERDQMKATMAQIQEERALEKSVNAREQALAQQGMKVKAGTEQHAARQKGADQGAAQLAKALAPLVSMLEKLQSQQGGPPNAGV